VIADPRRRREWNASVRGIDDVTPGPTAIGTRWTERTWGLGTFRIEVTEYEPDRRFAEVTLGDDSDLWLTVELTPVGAEATLVALRAGGGLSGWRRHLQRLLDPLMPLLIRADLDRAASR
jgi:hypothetical protein